MTEQTAAYALHLSEQERMRYRGMAQRALASESHLFREAGIVPGARVVDMGCGPGAMLVELARLVAPDGEAVGVEPNDGARAAARDAIAEAGVTNASVREGSGEASGLAAAAWDVVMIRHVLFHVGAAAPSVVAHAAGLVRPGGCLYLVDVDGTAIRSEPSDPDWVESAKRYQEFQLARGNNPSIGPRLHVLLADAGLEIAAVEARYSVASPSTPGVAHGGPMAAAEAAMVAEGAMTAADVERFAAARQRALADPRTRIFVPNFVAVGRKPA